MATTLLTPVTPRKTVALEDPEDVDLLREKLNQIAVGPPRHPMNGDDNNSDTASDEPFEGITGASAIFQRA
ncbi:hypothetical protein P43SY_000079 [Pythium insidiosum]|uniref:Uncharacterized protein n=1 Tax=Pythium insidiosum TaxID=114742 RepID=A0AAD5LKB9_PYTIN|nr:hypothetical protein P43SY_000079 [Pythium insidiosum]